MRFYTCQHAFYCGVDLHARTMYVCVLDQAGEVRLHRNLPCRLDAFVRAIAPFREDLVVGVECLFCWYWLADLCAAESMPFVLGHAYYMKAIHGGKSKNDRIDSNKIAVLPRGGTFPWPTSTRARCGRHGICCGAASTSSTSAPSSSLTSRPRTPRTTSAPSKGAP